MYYIGIEDLAANAIIEMSKYEFNGRCTKRIFTLKELEDYGNAVIKHLIQKGEPALMVLSRSSTTHMFNTSDYFAETEKDGEHALCVKDGIMINDLIQKYRTYIAFPVLQAFMSDEVVKVLNK